MLTTETEHRQAYYNGCECKNCYLRSRVRIIKHHSTTLGRRLFAWKATRMAETDRWPGPPFWRREAAIARAINETFQELDRQTRMVESADH